MNKIVKLILIFVFFTSLLSAQEEGKWFRQPFTDQFGDQIGDIFMTIQVNQGTGVNATRTSPQVIAIMRLGQGNIILRVQDVNYPNNPIYILPNNVDREEAILEVRNSIGDTFAFICSLTSTMGGIMNFVVEPLNNHISYDENNPRELIYLLKRNDRYRAILNGETWRVRFEFNGNIPQ